MRCSLGGSRRSVGSLVYDVSMKLYTKRGDDGQTDLIGGSRVPKNHLRVGAYGVVDELNATIGLALAGCSIDAVSKPLITAQPILFDIGAQLATPISDKPAPHRLTAEHVAQVEKQIDEACQPLPPLRSFILPGGSELAARLHLARTTCRRAERDVVALSAQEAVDPLVTVYLNRLSDLLFALARLGNFELGVEDVPWLPSS